MDNRLLWWAHLEQVEIKTAKRLGAISALAGSTWGLRVESLKQIYIIYILPLALYGLSV